MTRRRIRVAALACLGLLLVVGCSTPPSGSSAAETSTSATAVTTAPLPTPTTTPAAPASTSAPELAGSSEASAAAGLPDGPAVGTVVVDYDGLGQADSPFSGTCTRSGSTTTVSGTAGSADLDLSFDESGAVLTVRDEGLGTSTARLGRADLSVEGNRMMLSAPLVQEEQTIGSLTLDLTCGA